ncbi:MAG: histidinol-phosphatase [Rhodobacteraceae bacterium]|nr:histidinol-phosphatase [Paracoccaceae bacterium]
MTSAEIAELQQVAHRLADAAARITLMQFRQPGLRTDNKAQSGFDPVTEADRACEAAMRGILEDARPHDGILGEEFGSRPGSTGLTWILDPIDGTRGFIAGTPTWGTLIAVAGAAGPLYGLIDQPYTGERFEGGFGSARLIRAGVHTPLRTGRTERLADAILFTTFPEIGSAGERAAFGRVAERVRLTRYGMDCYAYALLALGQIDLVIEAGLHPYDIAAPIAVITAAGGVVTDWRGGPADRGGQVLAAANPEIHAAALALLTSEAES